MTKPATIDGKWRFTAMSKWDNDFIDLVEPGNISFGIGQSAEMIFGVVTATLDRFYDKTRTDISFDFIGSDEGDEVCGQGSAQLSGPDTITGEITFHNGDDTTFEARRRK